ncbi:hypothetical protein [Ktedonospora formicarum]|uniref:Uncharacterized protein n=1 Tax=Ktedonospora formicarum TaxID=2778364 RepID=A0A8J3MXH5_9CHLR|nr:hypothetical protein [Ktedonospora formicarum]GHO49753.1 hypothetical protein KSX_79160 [Ktedonospora formicarum]
MNQSLRRSSLTSWLCVVGMALLLACALLLGGNALSTRSAAAPASTESVVTQAIHSSPVMFTQAISASVDPYAHLREGVYWRDAHTPQQVHPFAWCSSVGKSTFC